MYRQLRHAVILATCALFLAASAPAYAADWAGDTFSPADEGQLLSLTNSDRAGGGLPALKLDGYLARSARARSADMAARDYFSHDIPGGGKVFDAWNADGYCYKVGGENIGLSTYGDDVATTRIEAGFMNSPTHRDIIMGDWTNIGVGAYKDEATGKKLYTVLFSVLCSPKPTAPPVAPKPTAPPVAPKPTAPPVPKPTVPPVPKSTPVPTLRPTAATTPSPVIVADDLSSGASMMPAASVLTSPSARPRSAVTPPNVSTVGPIGIENDSRGPGAALPVAMLLLGGFAAALVLAIHARRKTI